MKTRPVLDEVWDDFHAAWSRAEVRGALGLFLFTGDDVFDAHCDAFRRREGSRRADEADAAARTIVLLLDEPTNHLDMDSREVLEDGAGGLSAVRSSAISHDRYFINRFATKVCVLEAGGVKEYLGNYDDYFEENQSSASAGQRKCRHDENRDG